MIREIDTFLCLYVMAVSITLPFQEFSIGTPRQENCLLDAVYANPEWELQDVRQCTTLPASGVRGRTLSGFVLSNE